MHAATYKLFALRPSTWRKLQMVKMHHGAESNDDLIEWLLYWADLGLKDLYLDECDHLYGGGEYGTR